jgi:4-oxalocrotonate tautomerase
MEVGSMAILTIEGWKGMDDQKKKTWIKSSTDILYDLLDVPHDEIVVFVRDVPKENWGQAGVTGDDSEWAIKSREK